MEKLFKMLYKDIITQHEYDISNDDYYNELFEKQTNLCNHIFEILKKEMPKKEAVKLIDELDLVTEKIYEHIEYNEFKFFFVSGLTIGMSINQIDLSSHKNVIEYIRNSL